ncbi:MAG: hypothetical protein ABI068_08185 [Ktedonobacterales bacterium]
MSQYIHFGVILITIPNLIVIGLMIVVFAAAVAISLPQESATQASTQTPTQAPTEQPNPES